jgi:hypothetical protein
MDYRLPVEERGSLTELDQSGNVPFVGVIYRYLGLL